MPSTPQKKPKRIELDTVQRTSFFRLINERGSTPIKLVYEKAGVPKSTGDYLRAQRKKDPIGCYRRPGKHRTGRPRKISNKQLNKLLSTNNPVRNQGLGAQIEHFSLGVGERTLQINLRARTRNAQLFKKAKIKAVSPRNKVLRVEYAVEHGEKHLLPPPSPMIIKEPHPPINLVFPRPPMALIFDRPLLQQPILSTHYEYWRFTDFPGPF